VKLNLNWLDRIMLAITFAEANCQEEARGYLDCIDDLAPSHEEKEGIEGSEMNVAHAGASR